MKILFLSRWSPYPPENGIMMRNYQLVRGLTASHCEVDCLTFADLKTSADVIQRQTDCRAVELFEIEQNGGSVTDFLSKTPRSIKVTHSHMLEERLGGLTGSYDVVIASMVDMLPYALVVKEKYNTPILLEDLELALYRDQARLSMRQRLMWGKWQGYLKENLRRVDAVTAVSAEEVTLTRSLSQEAQVELIPNGVTIPQASGFEKKPEPMTLIYAGSLTYSANYDAMDWFLAEVFPLIVAECPSVILLITGRTDGVDLTGLNLNDNVTITGFIDDITSAIQGSWLSIVPLRVGAGTRLKILESLALGTPVISTPKGMEGLDLEGVCVEDAAETFASETINILRDSALRERMAEDGIQAVKKYDWHTITAQFVDLCRRVACREAILT